MATGNLIGRMPISDKLNDSNYDLWHLKVQFILNEGGMLYHLTISMPAPANKDERGMDITITEQYKQNLTTYQDWFRKDRSARYTLLSCVNDDLPGKFKHYPTTIDMWDQLKIRFGQTCTTKLRTLKLKWI